MNETNTAEDRGPMLVIFRELAEGLNRLDADDRHRIVDAVLNWYEGNEAPTEGLSPAATLIVNVICEKQRAYTTVCQNRRIAGRRSAEARQRANRVRTGVQTGVREQTNSMSTSMSMSKSTSESGNTQMCVRPTIDEVRAYCTERGNKVDAQAWYDFYTANGWRVGRNAMKDWRAAVRTWERNGVGTRAVQATKHGDNYCGANEAQVKEFCDGFGN